MRRLRIITGCALAWPLVGCLFVNRWVWSFIGLMEEIFRAAGWDCYRMDGRITKLAIKIANWAYSEK